MEMTWRRRLASAILDGRTLSRRVLNRELEKVLADIRVDRVLDIGGASGLRYRQLIRAAHYWTLDVQTVNRPTVVGDAHRVPIRDASIDLVLCIQVLEHCVHPADVLREALRVLAPGGRLVLSTVLLYELHASPQDYYRFTESALRDLARGFSRVEVRTLGNRFVAVYDLTAARSVALNSLLGRLAYRFATRPSERCPCGFVIDAVKGL